jgi:predicted small metal-binding protein
MMDERRIRTRCACGWERTGPIDEVVAATIEHGTRLHNMTATREQVLAAAEAVEPDGRAAISRRWDDDPGGGAAEGA